MTTKRRLKKIEAAQRAAARPSLADRLKEARTAKRRPQPVVGDSPLAQRIRAAQVRCGLI